MIVRPARRGTSLVEMLVVMAGLAVLLSFLALALWGTIRIERADAAVFVRTLAQSTLADQFRSDVAQSNGAPAKWDDFRAGPDCLILQKPSGEHIAYVWNKERLLRYEQTTEKRLEQAFSLGVHRLDVTIEFVRPDARLCLLKMRGVPGEGSTRPRFQLDVLAALGGELR